MRQTNQNNMVKKIITTPFQKFVKIESFGGILIGSVIAGISGYVVLRLSSKSGETDAALLNA